MPRIFHPLTQSPVRFCPKAAGSGVRQRSRAGGQAAHAEAGGDRHPVPFGIPRNIRFHVTRVGGYSCFFFLGGSQSFP